MKIRSLCALALFTAIVAPAIANAQAPAGAARVDSGTYFDTVSFQPSYSGEPAGNSAALSSWPSRDPSPGSSFDSDPWRSGHAGLLGKAYVRGSFLYHNITDQASDVVSDNSFVGWDAEINLPIVPLTTDAGRVDLFVEHNYGELSGPMVGSSDKLSFDHQLTIIGARLSGLPDYWFRPFVGIGAGFVKTNFAITGGTGSFDSSDSESDLMIDLGFEADIASNAAFRADFGVLRGGDVECNCRAGAMRLEGSSC